MPGADIAALWYGSSAGVAPQCLHSGELATFKNRIILQQDQDHEPGADDPANVRICPKDDIVSPTAMSRKGVEMGIRSCHSIGFQSDNDHTTANMKLSAVKTLGSNREETLGRVETQQR